MTDAVSNALPWKAPKVSTAELQNDKLLAIQTRKRRARWHENLFLRCITGAVSFCLVAQSTVTYLYLVPAQKLVPIILVRNPDGSFNPRQTVTDLPADQQKDTIEATMVTFIGAREGYNYDHAQQDYDLVSLMLDDKLSRQYQEWFVKSPDSPQATIGKGGKIDIKVLSIEPVARQDKVLDVRFLKLALKPGEPRIELKDCQLRKDSRCTTHTATVGYSIVRSMAKDQRWLDPARIKVSTYFVRDGAI